MSSTSEDKTCIGCLTKKKTSLFSLLKESNIFKTSYYEMLKTCFFIDTTQYFLHICKSCVRKLVAAYNLRKKIISCLNEMKLSVNITVSKSGGTNLEETSSGTFEDEKLQSEKEGYYINKSDKNFMFEEEISTVNINDKTENEKLDLFNEDVKMKKKNKEDEYLTKLKMFKIRMAGVNNLDDALINKPIVEATDELLEIENKKINYENVKKERNNFEEQYLIKLKMLKIKMCTYNTKRTKEKGISGDVIVPRRAKKQHHSKPLPFNLDEDATLCKICKTECHNPRMLRVHMNEHYSNFICDLCGKGFLFLEGLKHHSRVHEIGPFKCKKCDKIFERKNSYNAHYTKFHGAGRKFLCKICNKQFNTLNQQVKHMRTEHNAVKQLNCPYCDKFYLITSQLNHHIKLMHKMIRQHKCLHCDKHFSDSTQVKHHMIYRHNIGERKHVCEVCQKRFVTKYNMNVHMKTHT